MYLYYNKYRLLCLLLLYIEPYKGSKCTWGPYKGPLFNKFAVYFLLYYNYNDIFNNVDYKYNKP